MEANHKSTDDDEKFHGNLPIRRADLYLLKLAGRQWIKLIDHLYIIWHINIQEVLANTKTTHKRPETLLFTKTIGTYAT